MYGCCFSNFSKEKLGSHVEILNGGVYQTLKMCQISGGSEMFSITKVNIINFDYDHNILQQF